MIKFYRMADGSLITMPVVSVPEDYKGVILVNHKIEIDTNSYIKWDEDITSVIRIFEEEKVDNYKSVETGEIIDEETYNSLKDFVYDDMIKEGKSSCDAYDAQTGFMSRFTKVNKTITKQEDIPFEIVDLVESVDWRVSSVRCVDQYGKPVQSPVYKVKPFTEWLAPEIRCTLNSLGFVETNKIYGVGLNEFSIITQGYYNRDGGIKVIVGGVELFRDLNREELRGGYIGTEQECIDRANQIIDIFEDDLDFFINSHKATNAITSKDWLEKLYQIRCDIESLPVYKRKEYDKQSILRAIANFDQEIKEYISLMSNENI